MSDAIVPSYRVHREPSGLPWRMVAVAGGLLAVLAMGAAGWMLVGGAGGGGVPVVEADPRPFRIKPTDAGGLRVPNQDELVLERPGQRSRAAAGPAQQGALAPVAEAPNLNALRAAVQPPPAAQPRLVVAPVAPGVEEITEPSSASLPVPEAPAAAPVPPAARLAVGGRALVQLGALASEEAARAEWNRLAGRAPELFQGRRPIVVRLEREGLAPLFRLRAGGLADAEAQREFCEGVRAIRGACVPVR